MMLLRISTTFLAASLLGVADAFLNLQPTVAPTRTRLDMGPQQESSANEKGLPWGSAVATVVAGWTLAAQVASASLVHPSITARSYGGPENIPLQQSSIVIAREVETMDFSMPSYDAATKGSAGDSSSAKIPSFNPFGDFEPQFIRPSPTPESPAAPAPTPAPAAPAVSDDKLFELKSPDISLPEFKAPELPSFKVPELPKLDMPKLNLKAPELPKVSMPSLPSREGDDGSSSFSVPSFFGESSDDEEDSDEPSEAMQFKVPDLPKLSLPSVPEIKTPSFEGFKLPSFSLPELPKLGGGDGSGSGMEYDLDIPKFEMEAPKVSMPQISLPSLPSFGGGGESASSGEGEEIEPQEVRDERAREARQVFLSFDSDAKIIEQQAREARNLANEKKKLASEAKDEACKTRPGGKWICLRNPFTAGF